MADVAVTVKRTTAAVGGSHVRVWLDGVEVTYICSRYEGSSIEGKTVSGSVFIWDDYTGDPGTSAVRPVQASDGSMRSSWHDGQVKWEYARKGITSGRR